jgi:hypothetical protein
MIEHPLLARHLGCGDGLMLAGAAIELAKEYGGIRFPAWPGHYPTFKVLFADHAEVEVVSVKNAHEMFAHQKLMILTGIYKLPIEYWKGGAEAHWRNWKQFDQMIYDELGVPLEKKWDSFPWSFDGEPSVDESTYIFVHDDSSRGYAMNLDRIGRHWTQDKMASPDRSFDYPITWWAKVIFGASEVHVINSAFLWLCDLLPLPEQQRKIFHRYARPYNTCDIPTLRHQWTILD